MRRLLLLLLVLLIGPACLPAPIRSVVWGASIEQQIVNTPIEDGDGLRWRTRSGTTTAEWADDIIATMYRGRTVVVIGSTTTADAIRDGWTTSDEAVLAWIKMAAQPDDCVAMVRPGVTTEAEITAPGSVEAVALADAWITSNMPYTIDWQTLIYDIPTLIHVDGIHLADTEAARVRHDVILQAAALCRGRV